MHRTYVCKLFRHKRWHVNEKYKFDRIYIQQPNNIFRMMSSFLGIVVIADLTFHCSCCQHPQKFLLSSSSSIFRTKQKETYLPLNWKV